MLATSSLGLLYAVQLLLEEESIVEITKQIDNNLLFRNTFSFQYDRTLMS